MPQLFSCPCTQTFAAPPSSVAQHVRCPRCTRILLVPATHAPLAQSVPSLPNSSPSWRAAWGGLPYLIGAVLLIGSIVGAGIFLIRPAQTTAASRPEPAARTEQPRTSEPTAPSTQQLPPERAAEPATQPPVESHPSSPREIPSEAVLARLNVVRRQAGLAGVELDAELLRRCRASADPAREENGLGIAQPPDQSVDALLASPWSRLLLLDAALSHIGVSAARDSNNAWRTGFLLGRAAPTARGSQTILYPAAGQTEVPPAFPGNEVPDPLPQASNKVAGYPITVTFPEGARIRNASGRLVDSEGNEVPGWFSSPEKPANPAYARHQGSTLCLIARETLQYETRYRVEFSAQVNGQPWTHAWAFTTLSRDREGEGVIARAVERVNAIRRTAGLSPLVLDPALMRACQAHAAYIARNAPTRPNLNLNDEDDRLPGATPEGKRIARSAHISTAPFDPTHIVEGWVASFHYRFPLLDRRARQVGLGAVHGPRDWHAVMVLADPGPEPREVLLYPADRQTEVPLEYESGERPDPIPESKDRRAGFPIMALFPSSARVRNVTAALLVGDEEIPCWLSTPERPVVRGMQHNAVCLIARRPLNANSACTVRVAADVDGRRWTRTWSFRTRSATRPDRDAIALEVLAQLNQHRRSAGLSPVTLDADLSRGCRNHAAYLLTNHGHPSTRGLGMHEEDARLPGFTPEGKRAGSAAVIAGGMPPVGSVDDWMATFYHRIPLLDPDLGRIGFGFVQGGPMGWYTVLDATTGRGRVAALVYPADGQQDVPRKGTGGAGYPITLSLPPGQSLQNVRAELLDADGTAVAFALAPGQGANGSAIALLPNQPLKPGSAYSIRIRADLNRRAFVQTWTFTTAPL